MTEATLEFRPVPFGDQVALKALCAEYVWRVDHGFADRVPDLFTDDGSFETPWNRFAGRDELVKGWSNRATFPIRTQHHISSCRFFVDETGQTRGTAGFTLFRHNVGEPAEPVPCMVADHQDVYDKGIDGAWRFRSRFVVVHFLSNFPVPLP